MLLNDHGVYLLGAHTTTLVAGTPVYLTETATVHFRVQTRDEVDVAGETWPVAMTYVPGSQGDFVGVLRDSVELDWGASYYLVGTADNGPNQHRTWLMRLDVSLGGEVLLRPL